MVSTKRFKLLIGGMYKVKGTAEKATVKKSCSILKPKPPKKLLFKKNQTIHGSRLLIQIFGVPKTRGREV
jgi:hypothetical protein